MTDERNPELYIDIRVTFKEVHKNYTSPTGEFYEEWTEFEPVSIRRQASHYLSDIVMYDTVDRIWEDDDWQQKFVNGTLAALHGQETLF